VSIAVTSPADLADAGWDDILPVYEELAARPLPDHGVVASWLGDWSSFEDVLEEAHALAEIAYTADTSDPSREARLLRFSGEIGPRAQEQGVRLARRLLETGYEEPELAEVRRRFQNQIRLFRPDNVPLVGELERLSAAYQKRVGGFTVEWDGEAVPLPRLLPYLESPDRAVRERAFRLRAEPFTDNREELSSLYGQMLDLRSRVAANAGFTSYRDFAHREKNRFDYSPDDCARFHEAVEASFVPLLGRIRARHGELLGVNVLRPWDVSVDPLGRPPLRPFTNAEELVQRSRRVFGRLEAGLAAHFETLASEGLLDLESRTNKAPGAYSISLPFRRRPFIFQNAVGVEDDVRTLLHEAGHAFHAFETFAIRYNWARHPGSEMAEVASMAMELLAAGQLDEFYSEAELRRAQVAHLKGIVAILPHVATVDAFQQWVYTSADAADGAARDAEWLRLRERFDVGAEWAGLREQRVARFYQQLHFFSYPLYYIEYGLAQVAALQVWRNARRDHGSALAAYRSALALGGTRPLPELYGAAGAKLVFDAGAMRELADVVEERITELGD
jgi:oligoendopeptidase F